METWERHLRRLGLYSGFVAPERISRNPIVSKHAGGKIQQHANEKKEKKARKLAYKMRVLNRRRN